MNIVSGVNPKTGKKEIYKFADTDKGFQNAQDELDKMNKLKFKRAEHEWKSSRSVVQKIWEI